VPDPDPQELFDHMNQQLFGTKTPIQDQQATMSGFLEDYATANGVHNPDQIMQSYSPDQVRVLSSLAREFAVCDRWFGSAPCQTLPNRAFAHAGTSCGRVNNCNGNVDDCWFPPMSVYNTQTIFNVLEKTDHSWKVYNDTELPSLTRIQFYKYLDDPVLELHFRDFDDFIEDAKSGSLPEYAFIEPSFKFEPNDQHPAHNVLAGERFLYDIWTAVSTGPKWRSTLLLITYDEHGGCYDHCPPPWTATPPDKKKPQQPFDFKFDRYGPRVPAVLVSPYIRPGTVFRSSSAAVEYDHTSILATIRDWLSIPKSKMLRSRRVAKAPTLFDVLTLDEPRHVLPDIPPPLSVSGVQVSDRPLSSMQKTVIRGAVKQDQALPEGQRKGIPTDIHKKVRTESEAREVLGRYFKR
jgi:phospholipase C